MVVLATVAVVAPMFWVRAATAEQFGQRRLLAVVALSAGIPLSALAIYSMVGSPGLVGSAPAATMDSPAAPHAVADPANAGGQAGDMNAAIERLEARLASTPNDTAGWQLLAQSYEFVGRSEDAARAKARAGGAPAAAGGAPASAASMIGAAAAMSGPSSAAASGARTNGNSPTQALQDTAERARRDRDFKRATEAFSQLAARGAMNADLWADYADATGASRGRLDEAAEPMIRQALALDSNHLKGLWLLGSLQTQRGDARGALATWQKLSKLIPASSPDAKLIAANIEEARTGTAAAPAAANAPAAKLAAPGATLRGEVQLDARLRSRLPANPTVFIFARSVDQPGPPLAVMRVAATSWPLAFVLDDSMAMMPGRRLSDFSRVVVEARISRSGNATAAAGDLHGVTPTLDPHRSPQSLRVVINEEIR